MLATRHTSVSSPSTDCQSQRPLKGVRADGGSFSLGFGRPETEGFDLASLDTQPLKSVISSSKDSALRLVCDPQAAATVAAYVELALIARRFKDVVALASRSDYRRDRGDVEIADISGTLDCFASQWLWARESAPSAGRSRG